MANVTTNTVTSSTPSLFARIGNAFVAAMDHGAKNNQQMRDIRVLQAKSDEELKTLGLAREDIVAHVFGVKMYV